MASLLSRWLRNRSRNSRKTARLPEKAARPRLKFEALERRDVPATLLQGAPSFHLDLGSSDSPVAPGYTAVPLSAYSSGTGYGWESLDGMGWRDRGTSDPLLRDFHYGTDSTFLVDVSNGTYDVTAEMVDPDFSNSDLAVWAEGQSVASGFNSDPWSPATVHFQAAVSDGQLTLRFASLAGDGNHFSLNSLDIVPVVSQVRANGPVVALQPSSFSLVDLDGSTPDFASVQWDFEYDGQTFVPDSSASGNGATKTFNAVGPRTVAARVTDSTGASQVFTLDATVLAPASSGGSASFHLDFGSADSPVAAGYVGVPLLDYGPALGFGWQSVAGDGIGWRDRGEPDPLLEDFHFGTDSTFLIDVPDGTYDVTARMGDPWYDNPDLAVWAEGQQVANNFATSPSDPATLHFQATVADGQLSLRFASLAGNGNHFSLDGLDVTPAAPLPILTVSGIFDAAEPGTNGLFTFMRSGDLSGSLTAYYTVSGSATAGLDYQALSGSVTFDPSLSVVSVPVNVIDDPLAEGDETVTVALTASSAYALDTPSAATVTIHDDEVSGSSGGSITGMVWDDLDRDGTQPTEDPNEPVVPGVSVHLLDSSGHVIATTTTDDAGGYQFANLAPGTYFVLFDAPSGFLFTGQWVGDDPGLYSDPDPTGRTAPLVVQAGQSIPSIDAGLMQPPPTGTWILGCTVWFDANGDGVRNTDESGMAGIPVSLLDENSLPVADTVTDAAGHYEFDDLPAGTYSVRFDPPTGYALTTPGQGGDPAADSDADPDTQQTTPVTLADGVTNLLIGGGIVLLQAPQAPPAPAGPTVLFLHVGNKPITDAAPLRVAKWSQAFAPTGALMGPNAQNHDFIDRDPDRFNVFVYDKAAWDAGKTSLVVSVSSTNPSGLESYNDDPTDIPLVPVPANWANRAGWYWSDSQILVSNTVDDEYNDNTRVGPDNDGPDATKGGGKGWPLSDRTHRIALGGTLRADYTPYDPTGGGIGGGLAPVSTTAVVPVTKVVKLHMTILRDRKQADGGNAVIDQDRVVDLIRRANEVYAQVGIRLTATFQTVDPPTGVDLSNGLDIYSVRTVDGKKIINMKDEDRALLDAPLRTDATDDIEVYFVNKLFPENVAAGMSFWASGVPDVKYADSIVVSATPTIFTLPHEIGHILLDDPRHVDNATNLMKEGTDEADSTTASKRITPEQANNMLKKRPNLLSSP